VGDRVNATVAHGNLAAHAAKDGTGNIPIVAFGIGDPVDPALVANLKQAGGNLTGIANLSQELSAKS
jgi:ABC-type uncharacterized transport system substrate-binding protein